MLKHTFAALILTLLTCGCTTTETTPGQSSKSTQTKEVTNNNKETVKVEQPVINVKVTNPDAPATTTKTTKVVTEPSTKTTTKVQQSPTPEPTSSPVSLEKSPAEEIGFSESQSSVNVAGSNGLKTLDAKGRDLSVSGQSNQLTFQGKANSLDVSGDNNQISVTNVKSITLSGKGNHVNWTGEKPTVNDTGSGNLVAGQ